jgi:ATP-dependent helicase/nuclease subunit A
VSEAVVHVAASPQERARQRQQLAADPALSAFVSANAGSGKTTVLVARVLRLLLDNVPPDKILCLTYTKAAAAHMALEVFKRLALWTTLADQDLQAALFDLEGRTPGRQRLVRARRLFARAIETPGGLKIETIHAFCERILHLFPFEANVPARFEVLDEDAADELLASAKTAVLMEAAAGSDIALRDALAAVSLEVTGEQFDAAIRAAVAERQFLRAHRTSAALQAAMGELTDALGLRADETVETIGREMLEGGIAPHEWQAIARALEVGKTTDCERAEALLKACEADKPDEKLRCYLKVFFTASNEPRADKAFVTRAIDAGLVARMREERDRLDALNDRRRAVAVVARTKALLTLAAAIFARAETLKSARGVLDFDDLIDKTRTLLDRAGAGWVLYKLDAGIDHVLVDEAQDTNPAQWEILKSLTADFTAGAGARAGVKRTIFAVGDTKQSIFGFQGAEPRALADTHRHFRRLVEQAGERFEDVPLTVSFRSTAAILSAVDAVFARPENFRGLDFERDGEVIGTVHESSRPRDDGCVELWPPVRPAASPEPEAWTLPVDEPDQSAPPVVLAQRIARAVRRWTTRPDKSGRLVAPGEVLVLVRKRGPLFEAVIRALKQSGVPVAGADRLRLGDHIAVLDLIAAGRAALLPDDDLTLATALKTPFVGLDDDDLVRIGARRPDHLSFAAALRQAAERGDAQAANAARIIDGWRALADRHGPFGFYATLLGPLGARRTLVSRLGPEAGDAIDEFLSLALAQERREAGSLATFLAAFGDASHEIKRDMDVARGEVRVMTVHGAKGLEAEIVVIADACRVDEHRPVLAEVDVGTGTRVPAWMPRKDEQPRFLRELRQRERQREREEHNRLLYVAMTRAKDRLVVAPYLAKVPAAPSPDCWFAMIEAGLANPIGSSEALVEAPLEDSDESKRVWQSGVGRTDAPAKTSANAAPIDEPAWLRRAVPPEPEAPPLRPSSALNAADAGQEPRGDVAAVDARLVGTLVHALIEHLPALPEAERIGAARRFVAARAARLDPETRERIVSDALAVIAHPGVAPLFGPEGRAEAAIVGALELAPGVAPRPVSGQIDRLAVTADEVLFADFKTNARAPATLHEVPESYVTQLALYDRLLADLFPQRRRRAFLVWTANASVMEIPRARLAAAVLTID